MQTEFQALIMRSNDIDGSLSVWDAWQVPWHHKRLVMRLIAEIYPIDLMQGRVKTRWIKRS